MRSFIGVRFLSRTVWVVLCLSILAAAPAWSAAVGTLTVDENGNGLYCVNGTCVPKPGFTGTDPTGGVTGNVLMYNLPAAILTPGDVVMLESVGVGADVSAVESDVLRFYQPASGPGILIFYSDQDDPVLSLADTGLPTTLLSNVTLISEVGPEGDNGATYSPSGPEVGRLDAATNYVFISDSPEPSTVVLTASGLIAAALLVRRFRG